MSLGINERIGRQGESGEKGGGERKGEQITEGSGGERRGEERVVC